MWYELLSTWSGFLSFAVILLSAIAIPLGVVWALLHKVKGPIERAQEPKPALLPHHSEWHNKRYEH